jgi:hypothetical protein
LQRAIQELLLAVRLPIARTPSPMTDPMWQQLNTVGFFALYTQCSQPSRPSEITQEGTGRPNAVRPRVGRKRRRHFEAGRRQTDRTVGDRAGPSPVVIYRHPWIFHNIHNHFIKLIRFVLILKQDRLASAPSVQFYTNSV